MGLFKKIKHKFRKAVNEDYSADTHQRKRAADSIDGHGYYAEVLKVHDLKELGKIQRVAIQRNGVRDYLNIHSSRWDGTVVLDLLRNDKVVIEGKKRDFILGVTDQCVMAVRLKGKKKGLWALSRTKRPAPAIAPIAS